MELDNSYNRWIIISSLNNTFMNTIRFVGKTWELISYLKGIEYCPICRGRGVMYISDGRDDVIGEVCYCIK